MATELNEYGLSIASKAELDEAAAAGLTIIYGADTNFDSNSSDGQYFGITTQATEDYLEVLLDVYNMFDPDNTIGVQQDNLYWINGIKRKGASFSYINITITTDRALTLQGLDANANDIDGAGYTVSDNIGNQWILLDTQNPSGAGSYTYSFRARTLGAVVSSPNTITIPVSVVIGVTLINNATGVSSLGQDGETDAAFSARRNTSFANRSYNSLDGLYSDLSNLDGVVSVAVYENDSNVIDADGIPAHGFWAIVEGGSDADIAQTIYVNAIKAIPSKGDETYDIITIQNQIYTARWDRPSSAPLYIKFNLKPLKIGQTFNLTDIKDYIVANKTYAIGEYAETGSLTDIAIAAITATAGSGSGTALSLLISDDDAIWVSYLNAADKKTKWIIDAANIDITEI